VTRTLDVLAASPPSFETGLHAGHIALRAMCGYLAVRFEGTWEDGREGLMAWTRRFDAAYPELVELLPQAPIVTPSPLSAARGCRLVKRSADPTPDRTGLLGLPPAFAGVDPTYASVSNRPWKRRVPRSIEGTSRCSSIV
jgi:hypothetical protein